MIIHSYSSFPSAVRWFGFRLLSRISLPRLKMSHELMLVMHCFDRIRTSLYLAWQRRIMKEAKTWHMVVRSFMLETRSEGQLVRMLMRSYCWPSVS